MIKNELKELIQQLNETWTYNKQLELYTEIIEYLLELEETNQLNGTLEFVKTNNTIKWIYETKTGFELVLTKLNNKYGESIAFEGYYKDETTEPINKDTYYKLPVWFVLSCMSISRANSGKYKLTKTDEKQGNYNIIELEGIQLKVPIRALFDTNNKLDGIPSISFSTALLCLSHKLGLCQLKDRNLCYAVRGEKQASGTYNKNGYLHLNSYYKTILDQHIIKQLQTDDNKLNKVINYINNNFEVVRFNKKGDFRTLKDYITLLVLARTCKNTVFYGYTARDDILNGIYNKKTYNNLYINGSNKKYTNRFKTVSDIKEYINSPLKCLGECKKCKKCYTLKGRTITCLLHGSNIGAYFNTKNNRLFIMEILNNHFKGLKLTEDELKHNIDIITSLNKALKNYGKKTNINIEFKNPKELVQYIEAII